MKYKIIENINSYKNKTTKISINQVLRKTVNKRLKINTHKPMTHYYPRIQNNDL